MRKLYVPRTAKEFCRHEATDVAKPLLRLWRCTGGQLRGLGGVLLPEMTAACLLPDLSKSSQSMSSAALGSKLSHLINDHISKGQEGPEHSTQDPAVPSRSPAARQSCLISVNLLDRRGARGEIPWTANAGSTQFNLI